MNSTTNIPALSEVERATRELAKAEERFKAAQQKRHDAILAAYRSGGVVGPTAIARAAGLTKGRIMQIVAAAKRAA
jgi:hypothetical protein